MDFKSKSEFAEVMRVSRQTVHNWINSGVISWPPSAFDVLKLQSARVSDAQKTLQQMAYVSNELGDRLTESDILELTG